MAFWCPTGLIHDATSFYYIPFHSYTEKGLGNVTRELITCELLTGSYIKYSNFSSPVFAALHDV